MACDGYYGDRSTCICSAVVNTEYIKVFSITDEAGDIFSSFVANPMKKKNTLTMNYCIVLPL